MAKKPETELETKSSASALTVADYGEDAGAGFEHQTKADIAVPFIVLLQPMSPAVTNEVPGAKPGCFMNTVTQQVYDREEGFLFVPATTRRVFVQWAPRDAGGGGYRGQHEVESKVVVDAIKSSAKFGKFKTDDGDTLTDTFYVYGAVCDRNGVADGMALMAFWSTKIKAYKTWMTRLRQPVTMPDGTKKSPPLFANLARFTSVMMKNDKGSYYVPVPAFGDPRGQVASLLLPTDERYQMAKACGMLVASGEAKVNYEAQQDGGETAEDPGHPFG